VSAQIGGRIEELLGRSGRFFFTWSEPVRSGCTAKSTILSQCTGGLKCTKPAVLVIFL